MREYGWWRVRWLSRGWVDEYGFAKRLGRQLLPVAVCSTCYADQIPQRITTLSESVKTRNTENLSMAMARLQGPGEEPYQTRW